AQPVGALIHGVRYAATARVGSSVFVFGGEDAGREGDNIPRRDLATGGVQPAGPLPVPLGHAMAATIGGRILLMGGRVTPDSQTAGMWGFDPATARFPRAGRLPEALSDAAVASYGHRIWLLGGEDPRVADGVLTISLR